MFFFRDVCQALGVYALLPDPSAVVFGASIDTRSLQAGELFVALKGSRQDGHLHLEKAFENGASGALVDAAIFNANPARFLDHPNIFRNIIPVANPEQALTQLAQWMRDRSEPDAVIGVTGSVGKTSTKEFLTYLLSGKAPVLSNQGNFNNHLGLPLTLCRFRPEHAYCVAELGANHRGEIRQLAQILRPDCGILTQIAPAHLEGFGSLEDIYETKLELAESLPIGGCLILPDDDPHLLEKAQAFPVEIVRVGMTHAADYRVSEICAAHGRVSFKINGYSFTFPGLAGFLARNAAMALAAAELAGLALKDIPGTWDDFKLPDGRFQEQILDSGVRVIFDGYNANPSSFQKALEAFAQLDAGAGRKFLVFSDMLELGPEEKRWHEDLGRAVSGQPLEYAAAYGERSRDAIAALKRESPRFEAEHFAAPADAALALKRRLKAGDVVLLKASRGMRIEQIIEALRQPAETEATRP